LIAKTATSLPVFSFEFDPPQSYFTLTARKRVPPSPPAKACRRIAMQKLASVVLAFFAATALSGLTLGHVMV